MAIVAADRMVNWLAHNLKHASSCIGGLALALLPCGAWANSAAMPLGSSALPPLGYVQYCEREPSDCGGDPIVVAQNVRRWKAELATLSDHIERPAAIGSQMAQQPIEDSSAARTHFSGAIDAARLSETRTRAVFSRRSLSIVKRVNTRINGAIAPATDESLYGTEDYWATPLSKRDSRGDCEDVVLEKRRALLRAGVPLEALSIAIVRTRLGQSHAVLLVNTDRGELVLDNLTHWIVPWEKAPYVWIERQLPGQSFEWVSIKGGLASHLQ